MNKEQFAVPIKLKAGKVKEARKVWEGVAKKHNWQAPWRVQFFISRCGRILDSIGCGGEEDIYTDSHGNKYTNVTIVE